MQSRVSNREEFDHAAVQVDQTSGLHCPLASNIRPFQVQASVYEAMKRVLDSVTAMTPAEANRLPDNNRSPVNRFHQGPSNFVDGGGDIFDGLDITVEGHKANAQESVDDGRKRSPKCHEAIQIRQQQSSVSPLDRPNTIFDVEMKKQQSQHLANLSLGDSQFLSFLQIIKSAQFAYFSDNLQGLNKVYVEINEDDLQLLKNMREYDSIVSLLFHAKNDIQIGLCP
jgi:hypothetical protein